MARNNRAIASVRRRCQAGVNTNGSFTRYWRCQFVFFVLTPKRQKRKKKAFTALRKDVHVWSSLYDISDSFVVVLFVTTFFSWLAYTNKSWGLYKECYLSFVLQHVYKFRYSRNWGNPKGPFWRVFPVNSSFQDTHAMHNICRIFSQTWGTKAMPSESLVCQFDF